MRAAPRATCASKPSSHALEPELDVVEDEASSSSSASRWHVEGAARAEADDRREAIRVVTENAMGLAIAWPLLIIAIFRPIAARRYRRLRR